jgi:hypothetical protein
MPDKDYETVFCSNGWVEIRNPAHSDDQWIATDSPEEIRQ